MNRNIRQSGAAQAFTVAVGLVLIAGCARRASSPTTQRLVDLYRPEQVHGTVQRPPAPAAVEWRFDGPPASPTPHPARDTRGWKVAHAVSDLAVRQGRLVGRTDGDFPLLHLERTSGLDDRDLVHEVQIRMRDSAPGNVSVAFRDTEKVDFNDVLEAARAFPWTLTDPVVPGDTVRTYTLTSPRPIVMSSTRHVLLRPADGAGTAFEIESVRLVTRREHLAGISSGRGWHGLSEVYLETIVSRSPEAIRVPARLPANPRLDLAVGTIEDDPVTFRVAVRAVARPAEDDAVVLERTVTRPHRWENAAVDLDRFADQEVVVSLSLVSGRPNTLGFWGAPAVRSRGAPAPSKREASAPPQGVILIWADTLRRDHMSAYGYHRPTTPILEKLAAEGVLFRDAVGQATWTKVATPSVLTSLYPTSHRVEDFSDRLPSAATTIAEVYRQAGYATLSMSSGPFTGQFTNLHQGFEEVHESGSVREGSSTKTSRDYVDRLLPWLEAHRDVPFFVFLHVTDPHHPFKPRPPYDTLWTDPSWEKERVRQAEAARKFIADPLLKRIGMPTRADLVQAGVDPDAYADRERGWYDGSIRGMDAEMGRLVERLRALALDRRTVVAFTADHGEEFFEHGRGFHGQSVYGELSNMPLILWGPGTLPSGVVVEPTVQIIDVMPTLLDLSGLPVPEAAQGRTLVPLFSSSSGGTLKAAAAGRLAITEKAVTKETGAPPPRDTESAAIVSGPWKLIHNTKRPAGAREFELYDHARDPLDRNDVATQQPEVVQRLSRELAAWRTAAARARLKPDAESAGSLSKEELERLRSLGYIQ